MNGRDSYPWNDRAIAQLRALWATGEATSEIGRKMGRSKNAIVGKAHRLGLEPRPSPIGRTSPSRPRRLARAGRVTLAPLPAVVVAPSPAPSAPIAAPAAPISVGERPAPAAAPVRVLGRIVDCCWPIGEPGTRAFRFCDAPSEAGRPYCSEHCMTAFVRTPDRREAVA